LRGFFYLKDRRYPLKRKHKKDQIEPHPSINYWCPQ